MSIALRFATRLVWLSLATASLVLFFLALSPRFQELLADPYGIENGLTAMGFSSWHFAVYGSALDILTALAFWIFGLVLFLKRSNDWMVWLVSLAMVLFLVSILPVTSVLQSSSSARPNKSSPYSRPSPHRGTFLNQRRGSQW